MDRHFNLSNAAWTGKGILWGLELLKTHCAWNAGNGTKINLWATKWVDGMIPIPKTGVDVTIISDWNIGNLTNSEGQWDPDMITSCFDSFWSSRILALNRPLLMRDDEIYWPYSKTGNYEVKSGYALAFRCHYDAVCSRQDRRRVPPDREYFFSKLLWKLPGPLSWRTFIWKILSGSLPLRDELGKRGLSGPFNSAVCKNPNTIENGEHVFRDCPVASRLWSGCDLGIRSTSQGINLGDWICNWIRFFIKTHDKKKKKPNERLILFLAVLWTLWINRNNIIFRDKAFTGFAAISFCNFMKRMATNSEDLKQKRVTDLYQIFSGKTVNEDERTSFLIGNEGSCQMLCLEVDAAWKTNRKAAAGWVLYDDSPIGESSVSFGAYSPIQAEGLGIREALIWARDRNIQHLKVFSDCKSLIQQILGTEDTANQVKSTIDDIKYLSNSFHCISFYFIPRILNIKAHSLTSKAMSRN
ncbi:hypothetical protein vseg_020631 [Gypsophila vaccaria]